MSNNFQTSCMEQKVVQTNSLYSCWGAYRIIWKYSLVNIYSQTRKTLQLPQYMINLPEPAIRIHELIFQF
jgi:hypothetical protein